MDVETTEGIYEVPADNLPRLRHELEKLARKATKLGLAPILLEELGSEDIPYVVRGDEDGHSKRRALPGEVESFAKRRPGLYDTNLVYFRFVTVRVIGTTPRQAGWEFVATLQHLADEDGNPMNLLRTIPSFKGQLPVEYRTASPENCDHCQKAIKTRKETFIVRHEDGTWKQVGRNCTQDFLGNKDPQQVTAALELWLAVEELFGGAEEGGFGGGGEYRFGIEEFLAVTAAMIRKDGWCSRSKARLLNGDDYRA
jgi:hypothetical protein